MNTSTRRIFKEELDSAIRFNTTTLDNLEPTIENNKSDLTNIKVNEVATFLSTCYLPSVVLQTKFYHLPNIVIKVYKQCVANLNKVKSVRGCSLSSNLSIPPL